jgi:hypothetical protein
MGKEKQMSDKETTCGKCPHLALGNMMGLKTAYCSFGRDDGDGPIVPHSSEIEGGVRGNPTIMTLWRIPLECKRPDEEVHKSAKQAKARHWVKLRV